MGSFATYSQQTGPVQDVDASLAWCMDRCGAIANTQSRHGTFRIVHVDHTITILPDEPHLTPQALVSVIMVFECVPKPAAALEPPQHA